MSQMDILNKKLVRNPVLYNITKVMSTSPN